jgi:RNA polymerase sigma-70 factor (sigma-E family)
MTTPRDVEVTSYLSARLPALRRVALLLCEDWHRADDLVQAACVKLYVHWTRVASADNIDAYVQTMVVREYLQESRTSWARRVRLAAQPPDRPAVAADLDRSLDLEAAVATLPPRQRAALVLRFYCDQNVDQTARILGCSPGTVKSQTSKALSSLRGALGHDPPLPGGTRAPGQIRATGEVTDHA